jgi:ATP-dependent Lon protease
LQRVLEASEVENRLSLALSLLTNEKNIALLQKEINKQVDAKLSKQQREYFLREQMKSIKQVCLFQLLSMPTFLDGICN